MLFSVVAGLVLIAILTLFFHRTVRMDIPGSILAALLSAAALAGLIAGAIYAGVLFG